MSGFAARLAAILFSTFMLAAVLAVPVRAADLSSLVIEMDATRHEFQVEVAKDPASRAQGLMYRRSLEPDRGMLFDFEAEQPVSMWMKNTYIPLDMLFIRTDGVVHRIEANTTPHSTREIDSGAPVRYVLEVPAGTAKRLGIKRGARVSHAIIGK